MTQAAPRTAALRRGIRIVPSFVLRYSLLAAASVLAGCAPSFQIRKYDTNESLYRASMEEFSRKRWDNAVTGFERLTLDLGSRDTLLSRAHWYLARTHDAKKEYLLAAQSYTRLAESFPDDSLAAPALLAAGDAYAKLWRNPDLDMQYGAQAQTQYRLVMSLFPDSPLRAEAEKGSQRIDEWMATKDYEIGMHYVRRRAYESSLIYFKDVVKNFPNTAKARDALMRLVETYRRPELNYKEEAKETCASLLTAYAGDKDVAKLCSPEAATAAEAAASVKPAPAKPVPAKPKPKPTAMTPVR